MTVMQKAIEVVQNGSRDDLFHVLSSCVSIGTIDALAATQYLASNMYDGMTMNAEYSCTVFNL